ncbi:hypothetical protein MTHERMMSTA1_05650 [Methanosarcina thermophila MST-A1]|nr:hypothetical protein MTHERMMSTA1_05650 [Methanosarcina thermophila MST-A1]
MKSSSVIDLLSDKIDIKSLSNSSEEVDELESKISKDEPRINRIRINLHDEEDPFLPIFDIIRASIMRYDYATARNGLWAVSKCHYNIIKQNPHEEKRISEHVFRRIYEIWKLALKIKDSEFIYMTLTQYCYIGKLCTYPIEMSHSSRISSLLKQMPKNLIPLFNVLNIPNYKEKITQNNLLYTAFLSEYYLKEVFKSIVEMKEEEFQSLSIGLVKCVNGIGLGIFRNRYELSLDEDKNKALESLESSVTELSYFLRDIGVVAIKADSKRTVDEVILALDNIGKGSIDYNLIHSIFHIVKSLKIIGEESAKKGMEFESSTKRVVECLEELASRINSHSEKLTGEAQKQVIKYYMHINENYKHKRTKDALQELNNRVECVIRAYISSYVYTIGRESIRNNLLDVAQQCLKSLETIERILKNGTESRHIGEDIRSLGLEAVKKDQTYPLMEDIIKSLYSISLLQFGYMFDWDRDLKEKKKFLDIEYRNYLAKGLQIHYSDFEEKVNLEDSSDFSYTMYLDDIVYGEKKLIIAGEERKDIKCLYLKDIDGRYPWLKLFKKGVFKNSKGAYYEVPILLKKLVEPILEYALNSPSDETIRPFNMIIQSFENFGLLSIHFRDEFSLNRIFIRSLVEIGDSFFDFKYLEYDKDSKAWEYLDWVTTVVSNSIYKLAIASLRYSFVDSSTLRLQIECLVRIQKKYHNLLFDMEDKFEKLLEMIKESELEKPKRDEIITLIEDEIQKFKNEKTVSDEE